MFKSQHLLKLYEDVKNETQTMRRCMISGLDVDEKTGIQLGCGHEFRAEFFAKIRYKKACPYCGKCFDPEAVKKKCSSCDRETMLMAGKCSRCMKGRCKGITKSKSKTQCRNIANKNGYCSRHCDQVAASFIS